MNTRDILFIFSGAFHGLEDIINERLNKKTIGLHNERKNLEPAKALKLAESSDLVNFGFEHEFIGRLPIRVSCDNLSKKDLYEILTKSEHSIIEQYKTSFAHYGIKLKFKKKALKLLAEQAFEQKTGARGLVAVFENLLRPFKFELPSVEVNELEVDESMVKNPLGTLHHILQD